MLVEMLCSAPHPFSLFTSSGSEHMRPSCWMLIGGTIVPADEPHWMSKVQRVCLNDAAHPEERTMQTASDCQRIRMGTYVGRKHLRKLACLRVHRTKIGHCQLKFGDLLDKEIQFVVRFLGWLGRRLP